MSSIFISYRRVGALVHARALFERLRHEFGPNNVFIDLEGIDYGLDFVEILNEQLNGCQVMLAVIDPQWATATDRQGLRRIDREHDYVRTEIVTALSRGIRTVPVLIDGAEMPDPSDLPEPLRPLTRRNALNLDFNRFDAEVSGLIGVIRKILATPSPATREPMGPQRPPQQEAIRQESEKRATEAYALRPAQQSEKRAAEEAARGTREAQLLHEQKEMGGGAAEVARPPARPQQASQATAKAWWRVPWWAVSLGAPAIVLVAWIGFQKSLSDQAAPILAELTLRGVDSSHAAPTTTQPAGQLKQLLAPEERSGKLVVEERGKRAVVTLVIPTLFAGGGAQVASGHGPLFAAVGHALERVPGRITVVAHTDDQPVRSLRYADNFELSRARAMAVAHLLKPELSNFSRVQWTGLGSTEPRYRPPSSPENRMRNARIEIILLAG